MYPLKVNVRPRGSQLPVIMFKVGIKSVYCELDQKNQYAKPSIDICFSELHCKLQ